MINFLFVSAYSILLRSSKMCWAKFVGIWMKNTIYFKKYLQLYCVTKPQTISSLVTSKTLFLIEHEVASVMCFDQPTNDFLDKIHITYHVDLLRPAREMLHVRTISGCEKQ